MSESPWGGKALVASQPGCGAPDSPWVLHLVVHTLLQAMPFTPAFHHPAPAHSLSMLQRPQPCIIAHVSPAHQPQPLRAHTHSCTHMHTHVHTCTNMHTHVHTHTHTRVHEIHHTAHGAASGQCVHTHAHTHTRPTSA